MKKTLLFCLLSGLFGAMAALVLTNLPPTGSRSVAQEITRAPTPGPATPAPAVAHTPHPSESGPGYDDLTPEERVSVWVYDNVNRSVVNITTESVQARLLFVETAQGEGSGSVVTQQGHILTNFHVVDGARTIQVHLYDGKSYEATLVGADKASDIAVLRIDASPDVLFPVTFGNSERLRVGQRVYALGNPFGLERTLSTGILSSLNRTLPSRRNGRSMKQIIQIDASINPGSSGGPLLDSHGRMIGMNMAIASSTGDSAGVGFAIPVNTIARVVPQLIRNGRVVRPEIGIAKVYETEQGLLIAMLVTGGPAERAGLRGPRVVTQRRRQGPIVYDYQTVDRQAADLIVAVDNQPVRTGDDFLSVIESRLPGTEVTLTVVREGRRLNVPVQLTAAE
jgi:S1-C subfamily serine protease